jgi:hypothetical protein
MVVTEVTIRHKGVLIDYPIQTATQGKYASQKSMNVKEQDPTGYNVRLTVKIQLSARARQELKNPFRYQNCDNRKKYALLIAESIPL